MLKDLLAPQSGKKASAIEWERQKEMSSGGQAKARFEGPGGHREGLDFTLRNYWKVLGRGVI